LTRRLFSASGSPPLPRMSIFITERSLHQAGREHDRVDVVVALATRNPVDD
jgi:hypothetical protein